MTDKAGNLVVYSYDPMEVSSCSGRRLVQRADMCLPARATTSLRVANRFRHPLLASSIGKQLLSASSNATATAAASQPYGSNDANRGKVS